MAATATAATATTSSNISIFLILINIHCPFYSISCTKSDCSILNSIFWRRKILSSSRFHSFYRNLYDHVSHVFQHVHNFIGAQRQQNKKNETSQKLATEAETANTKIISILFVKLAISVRLKSNQLRSIHIQNMHTVYKCWYCVKRDPQPFRIVYTELIVHDFFFGCNAPHSLSLF